MAFGFVVDDRGPDKVAAGGAGPFALALAERSVDAASHLSGCPSCGALGEPFGCVGLVATPLAAAAERWLVDQLPEDIEGLRGFLLRRAIGDFGYDGAEGRRLREAGELEAPGPFTRHFGPFFRRFTVSSEQLVEELFGAGDVDPSHALAILVQLGAIAVDGGVLEALDEGPKLAELIERPAERAQRSACTLAPREVPAAAAGLVRYLRALHAGFVVDAPVLLFGP
jgi:hypothetical protein